MKAALQTAIDTRAVIVCFYQGSGNTSTPRFLRGLALRETSEGNTILQAMAHEDDGEISLKTFRLDRMDRVRILDAHWPARLMTPVEEQILVLFENLEISGLATLQHLLDQLRVMRVKKEG
jgi:predicted DNA-binding transcriptional regulator YafY